MSSNTTPKIKANPFPETPNPSDVRKKMSDEDMKKMELKLSRAKTNLVLDHPFFGTIALNMKMFYSYMVPTAATNGRWVAFNPHFCKDLSDEQMMFLVAHETMHPMLDHNVRRMGRDPKLWNQAGDYVINQLLNDDKIGKFIEGGCLNRDIYDAGNGLTDKIYDILRQMPPSGGDGNGDGSDGSGDGQGNDPMFNPYGDGIGQDVIEATGSEAEIEQLAADWKVGVAQAAQAAKMMGALSANMERFVDDVLNPKVDWRTVLQRFVEKRKTDMRTFARPSRRFIQQGLYMPSKDGEVLGELVFAIDCSGSIGQDELNQFAAEIRTVQEDGKPSKMHILYFDSEVCHYDVFEDDNPVQIAPHGGGGTAFSPVFRYMEDHGIEPVATVFLTDLYCSDYGDDPGHPVLWVSTCDHDGGSYGSTPFGEVVVM